MINNTGIYEIVNKINNKRYIGQAIDIEKRLNTHKKELLHNKHHNLILQGDFNTYGIESFEFNIVKLCEEEFLNTMEKHYIEKFNTTAYGYNIKNGNKTINRELRNKRKDSISPQELYLINKEIETYVEKLKEIQFNSNLNRNTYNLYLQNVLAIKDLDDNDNRFLDEYESQLNSLMKYMDKSLYTPIAKEIRDKYKLNNPSKKFYELMNYSFSKFDVIDGFLYINIPWTYKIYNAQGKALKQLAITKVKLL